MIRFNTLDAPRREPEAGSRVVAYLWAFAIAVLVPALIVLVGMLAKWLESGGIDKRSVRLGTHLTLPLPKFFAEQPPVFQLGALTLLALVVAALFCLAVWMHRRAADRRASRIVKQLHKQVLSQSLRRAELEGAAAQHIRAQELIGEQLPELQHGLSMWYRSLPRSVLLLVSCVALALVVNVWLAVLAVIIGFWLWKLYQQLRGGDDSELTNWEVPRSRQRMAELVGQAPKLARLHAVGLADSAFEGELDSLYRRLDQEDIQRGRIWPLLFLATATAIGLLIFGLGVNLLEPENGLSVPASLVLGLSLSAAAVSGGRLSELSRILKRSGKASDSIYHFLRRSDDIAPTEQRVGLAAVREGVEIQDVTLNDSGNTTILSHLTLDFTPKSLVALLGTDPISTKALTELLMGFGRPSEGQVLIDGIRLLDIHPKALADNVMWIEPDGPIWDGTIMENLKGGDEGISSGEIVDALEKVGVYERIQRLPESLSTFVTASDSQLDVETTYAIAVARALLHKPPILLAMEPPPPTEHLNDDPCLRALQELVDSGALVVVLPRRIQTLRSANRVILLNGPRLVGEGKHAELLNDSDLYRHLNYLLFNPYRHQKSER